MCVFKLNVFFCMGNRDYPAWPEFAAIPDNPEKFRLGPPVDEGTGDSGVFGCCLPQLRMDGIKAFFGYAGHPRTLSYPHGIEVENSSSPFQCLIFAFGLKYDFHGVSFNAAVSTTVNM